MSSVGLASTADNSVADVPAARGHDAAARERDAPSPFRRRLTAPLLTLVIGLLITAAAAWVAENQYTSNEQRLLRLRVRDAGSVLTAAVPDIQTTLASAAELADATHGNAAKFRSFMAPFVGSGPRREFVSASLWQLGAPGRGPIAVAGEAPKLASDPGRAATFLAHAARTPLLAVVGMLAGPDPRVGYEFNTRGVPGGYAAYGESTLPASRRAAAPQGSTFTGVNYALYLGAPRPQNLLAATGTPLPGSTAAVRVPFGDTMLTLVMSTQQPLTGSLPQQLPWIVAVIGVILSVAAAAGVLRLTQQRQGAETVAARLEAIAEENRRLYAEQRTIARTLQHALLPDALPQVPGLTIAARYQPGEEGVEVGGDWYDVLPFDGRRVLLVVGDVSGRGVAAATTMAALRYAIHGYAVQQDAPGDILTKLSSLLSVADRGQMATILCALVDLDRHEVTLASAGHLPPLLIADGEGRYLDGEVGIPIGIERGTAYPSTTVATPAAATLIAYTDGLVERRRESLDAGLQRLKAAATPSAAGLDDLLDRLVAEVPRTPSEDDIALVGLSWTA